MMKIKHNKLLANFIGAKSNRRKDCLASEWTCESFAPLNGKLVFDYQLKFDSHWNWLMAVVKKIETIHDPHHGYFAVYIGGNSCTIQGTNLRTDKITDPPVYFNNMVLGTKEESTYAAVVEFVKWYKKNYAR